MSVSIKRSRDLPTEKGYRIVGSINSIEESVDVPIGQIVFETTETIKKIKCDADISMSGKEKTIELPGTEDLFIIKPQKHVKVMALEVLAQM